MVNISFSDANKLLDKVEFPIGAIGFTLGVAGEDIKFAQDSGTWDAMSTEEKGKLVLGKTIARTTGVKLFPETIGTGQGFSFNPTGFLNKGLAIWAGSWLYGELGLPHASTVKKIGIPLGTGWTFGGLFDPPPQQQGRTPAGLASPAGAIRTTRVSSWFN